MAWLEKLRTLFKIDIKGPFIVINIKNRSNNKIEMDKGYSYDEDKEILNLYLESLDNEKKKEIKPILHEYIQEGNELLETETAILLDKLYQYNKEKTDHQILTFFEKIIPLNDFLALEASLYLRHAFKRGSENIKKLKDDIRKKFGDRGKNIANLCTAGYFEGFLMPLYNESEKQFDELYDLIVSNALLAVFVHKSMTSDQITENIKGKIETSKRYGIKFLHIHGIGKTNVETIKDYIQKNKESLSFYDKSIFEKQNIIIFELLL